MSTPVPPKGRLGQMRQAFALTRRADKALPFLMLLAFVLVGGVTAALVLYSFGTGLVGIIIASVLGLISGVLAAMIVFGRRAEKAAYAQVEGTPGAAAGVLDMMRGGWVVKPAIAFNRNQDVVSRVVGRPGVILVGEGDPGRLAQLMSAEKKKHQRIVGENIPVLEVLIGRGDGQVPLPRINKHVRKLPKAIKPAEMTDVVNKLKALDSMRPVAPIPRGPMNVKGAKKAMRG